MSEQSERSEHPRLVCVVCKKGQGEDQVTLLQQCSRCKSRAYCGRTCQKADWPTHKKTCKKSGGTTEKWYYKHRRCKDGTEHEGDLELITWSCPKEGTGWGNIVEEESADLRRKFEEEFGGSEEALYKHWPMAFRWTCCGTDAEIDFGCDHHGSGSTPCTCDFCRMGKPLPNKVYNEQTASRMGLSLRRGPDPRSFHVGNAAIATAARSMMGLEM